MVFPSRMRALLALLADNRRVPFMTRTMLHCLSKPRLVVRLFFPPFAFFVPLLEEVRRRWPLRKARGGPGCYRALRRRQNGSDPRSSSSSVLLAVRPAASSCPAGPLKDQASSAPNGRGSRILRPSPLARSLGGCSSSVSRVFYQKKATALRIPRLESPSRSAFGLGRPLFFRATHDPASRGSSSQQTRLFVEAERP